MRCLTDLNNSITEYNLNVDIDTSIQLDIGLNYFYFFSYPVGAQQFFF